MQARTHVGCSSQTNQQRRPWPAAPGSSATRRLPTNLARREPLRIARATPLELADIPQEAWAAGGAAIIAVAGAIAAAMNQAGQLGFNGAGATGQPEAAAPEVTPLPRSNAVLVFGATGRSGKLIIQELVRGGRTVIAAVRSADKAAEAWSALGLQEGYQADESGETKTDGGILITQAGVDVTDESTLTEELFRGVTQVVSALGGVAGRLPDGSFGYLDGMSPELVEGQGVANVVAAMARFMEPQKMTSDEIMAMRTEEDLAAWERLDDVIMGGSSSSGIRAAEDGTGAVWTGDLIVELSSLVTLLPWVQRRLAPQLLVVKSEALAEAAGSWLAEERRQAAAAAAAGAAEKARPGEQQEKAAESAAKPPAEQRPGRERSELHWSKVKDLDLPAQSKAMDSCGAGAGSSSATCGNSCGAGGSGISSGLVFNGARPPSFGDAGAGLFESGTPSPLSPLSASGATPRDACSADAAVRGRFVFTLSLARVFLGLSCLLAASLVIEVLLVRIHQPSSSANTNMAGGGAGFAPVVVTAWSPRIAALLPPALRPLSIGAAHAVPLAALTALSVAGMLAAIVVAAAAELVDACSADVGEEEEQEQEQQQEQQQQRRQRQRQRQEHEEGPGLEREQPVPRSVPSSKQQRPGTATAAAATAAAAGRVHDPSAWWEKLRGSCGEAEVVSNPLFYKAKLKGFHRVHPMKFPERRAPGGARICRPFNYATCKEGDRCPFDHAHCHHCLAPGHKAQECGA